MMGPYGNLDCSLNRDGMQCHREYAAISCRTYQYLVHVVALVT